MSVPACFNTHPAIASAYLLGFRDALSRRQPRDVSSLPAVLAVAYMAGGLDAH